MEEHGIGVRDIPDIRLSTLKLYSDWACAQDEGVVDRGISYSRLLTYAISRLSLRGL